jgi:FkbM family methyltransferase
VLGTDLDVCVPYMSRLFSRVYALEPDPAGFAVLRKNVPENVSLYQMVLSDSLGVADCYLSEHGGAAALRQVSFVPTGLGSSVSTFEVETIPLDALDLDRLDILWINSIGAEKAVLQGASETLRVYKPAVFVKFLPEKDESRRWMRDHMRKMHYSEWAVEQGVVQAIDISSDDFCDASESLFMPIS